MNNNDKKLMAEIIELFYPRPLSEEILAGDDEPAIDPEDIPLWDICTSSKINGRR